MLAGEVKVLGVLTRRVKVLAIEVWSNGDVKKRNRKGVMGEWLSAHQVEQARRMQLKKAEHAKANHRGGGGKFALSGGVRVVSSLTLHLGNTVDVEMQFDDDAAAQPWIDALEIGGWILV